MTSPHDTPKSTIAEIDARALAQSQASAAPAVVIDVREGWEVALGALPNAVHVPLTTLGAGAQGLPESKEQSIVTYCHHGVRSMRAAVMLQAMGYHRVASLKGGIDAWATDVDAGVGRY